MAYEKITEILSTILDKDLREINETDNLAQYGLGSLNSIDLVISLESEFDVTLEGDDLLIENINTVQKIKNLLEMRKN
jgi:acyl carrier protein